MENYPQVLLSQSPLIKQSACSDRNFHTSIRTNRIVGKTPTSSDSKIRNLQYRIIKKFSDRNRELREPNASEKKFSKISQELHSSNAILKVKKFRRSKNINPDNLTLRTEKDTLSSSKLNERETKLALDNCEIRYRCFDDFLHIKRQENNYLKNKMKIFGNIINDHEKILLQNQIQSAIARLNASAKQMCSQHYQKQYRYIISYMILEKFLILISKNPENLSIKRQFSSMYKLIKEEMISIMLDQADLSRMKSKIDESILSEQRTLSYDYSFRTKVYMQKLKKNRKPFYMLKQPKKDSILEQIQILLEKSKSLLRCSLANYHGCNTQVSEFEQRWNDTDKLQSQIDIHCSYHTMYKE